MKSFVARKEGALPQRRGALDSLTPAQNVIKIVLDEADRAVGPHRQQKIVPEHPASLTSSCWWACGAPARRRPP